MKKFLNSKYGETITLIVASVVNLIITIGYYSVKLSELYYYGEAVRGEETLWTTQTLFLSNYKVSPFNTIFIAAFLVGLLLIVLSVVLSLFKNKKWTFYISVTYNLVLSLVVLFVNVALNFLRVSAVIGVVLSVLVSTVALILMIVRRDSIMPKKEQTDNIEDERPTLISPRNAKALKIGMLVCECVVTFIYLITLFLPIYSATDNDAVTTYYLIEALIKSSNPLHINIAFMVMVVACFAGIFSFTSTVASFAKGDRYFVSNSQKYMYTAVALSTMFFALGYGLSFYSNLQHSNDEFGNYFANTTSYIPSLISAAVLVVYSVLQGRLSLGVDTDKAAKAKEFKIEPLIYIFVMTAITFVTLALKMVQINVKYADITVQDISLSGYDILSDYVNLEGGFQVMAFVLLAILLISGAMFIVSLVSFFSKSNDYYKIIKVSAFANVAFTLILGLFGLYYKIAQKINEESILAMLEYFEFPLVSMDYVEDVSSQSYYAMIASFVMLAVMLIRGQFNLRVEQTAVDADVTLKKDERANDKQQEPVLSAAKDEIGNNLEPIAKNTADIDVCPAFTELDMKIEQFDKELSIRQQSLFTNFTLPNLVRFVVDYARECRLHLSYSLEDIATFVAGLGASRLSILQGMSGTGKTSLPKIFTEALMGTCEIVEVESSWRDKNELLGYYNEFSKCYTPKKFTQSLYKARLNSTVPTFIVLDEMNLSRIEYYFSDFLSLMENEEDKREIKLLNIKLARIVDGQAVPYAGLTDGHTIKIPANVWFIGTANRDESTFEISDKVYDRAQTMNFNKRAPKVHSFSEPLPQRFVSYDMIAKLFDEAKQQYTFDAEQNVIVQKVEKLLMPYNISFGNRILKQMEEFVKIYCTCFGDKSAVENDAVERILLSKVVSKLENKIVENKQALATEFSKLGLSKCSEFILKLNED